MAKKVDNRPLYVQPTQEVTGWDVIGAVPLQLPKTRSGCTANVVAPKANPRDEGPLYEQNDPLAPTLQCGYCQIADPGCGCWAWKDKYGEKDYSC